MPLALLRRSVVRPFSPHIPLKRRHVGRGGEGGAYSFVARLNQLAVDHASLSRRSTAPIPTRETNIWALSAFLSYVTYAVLSLSHPSPLRGELLITTPDVSQGFQGGVFPTKNTNQLRGDGSGEA